MAKTGQETPMMQQYNAIKAQYPDAFLFYRLGDFYELFNDDAVKAAQILELTLTQRNKKSDNPVPMAGVPHHAAQNYIDILVDQGYKVAVVEQLEDASQAEGMVKRDVVQLVTPGTRMRNGADAAKENNYLVSLTVTDQETYGLAYADLSTGEIKATHVQTASGVLNELARLETLEIVTAGTLPAELAANLTSLGILTSTQSQVPEPNAEISYLTQGLEWEEARQATMLLLDYLFATQKRSLDHLQQAQGYEVAQFLKLDRNSRANLELTLNLKTQKRSGTLLWLLDQTKTAMGGRLLKQWIEQPILDAGTLQRRYDRVGAFKQAYFERAAVQEQLTQVYDLERLVGRVAYGTANGRDLLQLKQSLAQVPGILDQLATLDANIFADVVERLDPVDDVKELIATAITDEPPISVTDGGVIRAGYNAQLDTYRETMAHGKQWLAELEQREREATGISTLKIGYNKVFGYYIEVTKANIAKLEADRYTRKQTLTNAERFITPELKEQEQAILEAESESSALEYRLFTELRETVKANITRLQKLAAMLAELDVLQSLAEVAEQESFVRPTLAEIADLSIENGRHPVVEKVIGHQAYVGNDVQLNDDTRMLLITGPNMSGKSTYMRQLALTVVMAQLGSFVPATAATLPIFDQIFTRIGAADDLISGNSTFMVEMAEANTALQHATPQSLILFDELGRGTATYDGMALAQAIIEHVHDTTHAKTLFSTHYHELTDLSATLPHLENVHVGATEEAGQLIFSHKVLPGPADQSYGINVAKLAGLPDGLITRADAILHQLEGNTPIQAVPANEPTLAEPVVPYGREPSGTPMVAPAQEQLNLFTTDPVADTVIDELRQLSLLNMTPIDILNQVNAWQNQLK